MVSDDIIKNTKNVPLFAFQVAIPSIESKRKKPYVEYLQSNDPSRLINLVEFWRVNRYKHFYLYKLNFQNNLSSEEITEKFETFQTGIANEEETIYEIKRVNKNHELNDLYSYIKIHSPKKHFKSEDYRPPFRRVEMYHRKPYYVNIIFHIEDSVVECRTPNFKKSKEIMDFIKNVLFEGEVSFQQIIIQNAQLMTADANTKCKEIIIQGEWFGSNQIQITGEDVKRCVNEFESKGINFSRDGLEILEKRNESEELLIISDSSNGKISIKKVVEQTSDPYRYLKSKLNI